VLGVLYDIHGNLPALEAVLAEADELGVDRWLLGGDYGTPSPWPLETLGRLKQLEPATWIRGNGERWLRDPPTDRPEVMQSYELFTGGLPDDVVDWLYALPVQAEVDGVLFVHGSPLSDVESFAPESEDDEARMLAGVHDRLIVFGHSHQQFRRPGPDGTELLNPGSVGQPRDGDPRASYLLLECRDDGLPTRARFLREPYDVGRTQREIALAGLPQHLADRLSFGM